MTHNEATNCSYKYGGIKWEMLEIKGHKYRTFGAYLLLLSVYGAFVFKEVPENDFRCSLFSP
jgi:hypothetical protein